MGGCATRPGPRPIRPIHVGPALFIPSEVTDEKNLESYYLFWLDNTVKSPELIETHGELRSIINYLKPFETNLECQKEFEKIIDGKIFLIGNSFQILSLLSIIHNHKQLHSIYIYQNNNNNNDMKQITDKYKKVKGIYDSIGMAKRYLEDDVKVQTDLDEPIVIDLSNDDTNKAYREKFTLFLKIVNVNAKDIYDAQTRKRLINMCMEYYHGNENELNFMKKFSRSYKPEEAISWYMRSSCLHRLLSSALNNQDMNLLVDMYSFIVDVNRNLKQNCIKQSSPLRVYRGQLISNEKLSLLKNNINQTITMQCFLTAQTSQDAVTNLLQHIESNDSITCSRILFEIDVIQDYTFVDNEESSTSKTVLFMLGAMFKIIDVTETTIELSQYISYVNDNNELANESSVVIRGILTYLELGPKEAIEYFTNILRKESQFDLAVISSIYGQLGYLHQKLGNTRVATEMYEKSLHNGSLQFSLYLYYLDQTAQYHATVLGDWKKAKMLWSQKLTIENTFLLEKEKAQTYENLARAELETKQYAKVVEYTSAAIDCLSNDHPHLSILQQQLDYAKNALTTN